MKEGRKRLTVHLAAQKQIAEDGRRGKQYGRNDKLAGNKTGNADEKQDADKQISF